MRTDNLEKKKIDINIMCLCEFDSFSVSLLISVSVHF